MVRTTPGACAALLMLLACAAGCRSGLLAWPDPDAIDSPDGARAAREVDEQEKIDVPKVMATDQWAMALATRAGQPGADGFYWQHQGLAAWQASAGDHNLALKLALADGNPIVAANAAILLGRAADDRGLDRLVRSVGNVDLRVPLRAASAEALGRIQDAEAGKALELSLDALGRFDAAALPAYVPRLHAELLTALASWSLAENPRFAAALASPAPEVRRAALWAWRDSRRLGFPPAALELRADPEPAVRGAWIEAVVAQRPEGVLEYLTHALDDLDPEVRASAIAGLGAVGGEAARARLVKLQAHPSELVRATTVPALATAGAREAVESASHDKSWLVRQAVARSLARPADATIARDDALLAQRLVRDASVEVQKQTIASLASWPLADAGPVLIAAIAEGNYQTRHDAAGQLAAAWPAAGRFPFDAAPPVRTAALDELRQRWAEQFGPLAQEPSQEVAVAAPLPATVAPQLPPAQLAEARRLMSILRSENAPRAERTRAAAELAALGPPVLALLESAGARRDGSAAPLPPAVFEEVLPKLSSLYAAIEQLRAVELLQRRTAATQLVVAAANKPLPELALARLVELEMPESDPVVWQCLLTVTASDSRPPAVELAYAAIGNASADVRRRACEYLAAHPDRRHVPVLMPALADTSPAVLVAAARALGATGHVDDPGPLERLLLSPDKTLRVEAATALARLKVDEGAAALERLAADADNDIRRRAASAMGELADEAYLPTLVELASGPVDVQRAAFASLTQVSGVDFSRDEDGTNVPRDQQAQRWQRWYRDLRAGPGP